MDIKSATNAYQAAASIGGVAGGIDKVAVAKNQLQPDFIDSVGASVEKAIQATRNAETITSDALLSKATFDNLVLAINNADLTVKAVVAVRDKFIQAYQDIIKMPI